MSATSIMLIQHLPLLSSKRIVLASASPRRSELLCGLVCLTLLPFPFSSLFLHLLCIFFFFGSLIADIVCSSDRP